MTGIVDNQQSGLTGYFPCQNKIKQSQSCQYSSVEGDNICEGIFDSPNNTKESYFRCDRSSSDNDSGIEDSDSQVPTMTYTETKCITEETLLVNVGVNKNQHLKNNLEDILNRQRTYFQSFLEYLNDKKTLALQVPDSEKKDFCSNTCDIFHGDFAVHILCPLAMKYFDINYYLLPESSCTMDPCTWSSFAFVKLDNAKAHFQCPNIKCGRLWTSMRARISFKISYPQQTGFVVFKLYGQACQACETLAQAFWYPEEICRVMKNLAQSLFRTFFPEMIEQADLNATETIQNINERAYRSRHDKTQRMGKPNSPHDKMHCEACLWDICFT